MIAAGHLALYRDGQARLIEQKMADRNARIRQLRNELAKLEGEDDTDLQQALIRARTLAIDPSTCPNCAIWRGKRVELRPVAPPEGADEEVDYVVCADRCGFDNLP